jgi:hypothetical protein
MACVLNPSRRRPAFATGLVRVPPAVLASVLKWAGAMIKAFLSYSHKDEALRRELDEHLGALKHEKIIDTWYDGQIPTGNTWSEDIARELEAADLIILLVSSAFLDSTYCYVHEMGRAIQRHDAGEARVVPVILRPCYWEPAPFARVLGLPKNMVPITTIPEGRRDEIWTEVAKGIHQAATICSDRKYASSPVGSSATLAGSTPAAVTLTGVRSVDELQLDAILKGFTKGDNVGINWPKSSDQLLSLMQEVINKFDQREFRSEGADHFIQNAPAAIRDSLRDRAKCEKRLPELMSIMSDFGWQKDRPDLEQHYRNCRADAIKFYLLRANFLAHWTLGYLSSWQGLKDLNLQTPDSWVPYRGMPSDKFYPLLYDQDVRSYGLKSVRLVSIGEYKIMNREGNPNWIYIDVPSASVDRRQLHIGERDICRWAIPQVELSGQLDIPLPSSYNGEWEGYSLEEPADC